MKYSLLLLMMLVVCACNQSADQEISDLAVSVLSATSGPELDIKLPPGSNKEPDLTKLNQRNVMWVLVNVNDSLFVNGESRQLLELTAMAKQFVMNPDQSTELAESPHHAIIDLKNDRGTTYEVYLNAYNALMAAYKELWNEKARELYGKPYSDEMPFAERKAIKTAIPMVLSESEPTSFGE